MRIFIAGCIGALAPEVVRLYEMRSRRRTVRFDRFYICVSIAYILLGGYTASIFPGATTEFTSMSIGVGLVCVVNTMARIAGRLVSKTGPMLGKDLERFGGKGGLRDPLDFPKEKSVRHGNFWDFSNLL
jgi:hypothetical protein